MQKPSGRQWVYTGLSLLFLAIIWGNSVLPGEISGELSSTILEYAGELFRAFGNKGEFVLRKCAHFSEYAVLGFLLGGAFTAGGKQGLNRLVYCLLLGLLTACVDETIQLYAIARGSSLIDVWIDTAGCCTGILLHEGMHRLRLKLG